VTTERQVLQENLVDSTTEPSDLLTTNSDIVNEEIGPFAAGNPNGSIVFEVGSSVLKNDPKFWAQ
jgi:hypothetical protein